MIKVVKFINQRSIDNFVNDNMIDIDELGFVLTVNRYYVIRDDESGFSIYEFNLK